MINSYNDLKKEVSIKGTFVEVSEQLFYDALGSVPPIYIASNMFQMGEAYSNDLYYTFFSDGGKYYGCLCNKNFALSFIG